MAIHDEATGDTLGTLIRIIGREGAFRFVEAFAGENIYIPVRCTKTSRIVAAIGVELATVLGASELGMGKIKVPVARLWRIVEHRQRGASISQIARATGASHSAISRAVHDAGLTRSFTNRQPEARALPDTRSRSATAAGTCAAARPGVQRRTPKPPVRGKVA